MAALMNVLDAEALPSVANNEVLDEPDINSIQPLNAKEFAQAITSQLLSVVDSRFGTCHDHVRAKELSQSLRSRQGEAGVFCDCVGCVVRLAVVWVHLRAAAGPLQVLEINNGYKEVCY